MASQEQQEQQEQPAPQQQTSGAGTPGSYKRASRKGAPKKFACDWPDCDKIYSRHEHLQRHQLNHEPRQIYKCDVPDCNQMFVRQDLLARHKKRHSTSYVPRNRASSFSLTPKESSLDGVSLSPGIVNANGAQPGATSTLALGPAPPNSNSASRRVSIQQHPLPQPPPPTFSPPTSVPRNASVLLSPNSSMHGPPTWSQPQPMEDVSMSTAKANYYPQPQTPVHDQSGFMPFSDLQVPHDPINHPASFGFWLFDPQRNFDYNTVSSFPFVEGGLETPFNNNIYYDHESLASRSQVDQTPPHHNETSDDSISDERRVRITKWIIIFRDKQNKYDPNLDYLLQEPGSDVPCIPLAFLCDCLRHYWDIISPRMPIIHKPTFSPSRCPIPLLLVMIALGAAQIHNLSATGAHEEYKVLANIIITSIRLEILGDDGAAAPVDLWAAQALLLVEFYEKMYSTRKLHERGHIYHSVTLNLLRRGSPLIGKAGLESPPDEQNGVEPGSDDRAWWVRWAETEAMHRVVFVAFMMDIVHAAMFGHAADMAPHEIRLPLPCDESLWSALNHVDVRNEEERLRMYGIKPVLFLDGLKRAIHGHEVTTHSFGRMIIMCGLLSVGWHIRHRETHLKWLEMVPNASETREKWCRMLLKAFDDWKKSFDDVIGPGGMADNELGAPGQPGNGLIQSAAVLYHLAHVSLYVDIIDCQVFAGAKRLLGRKVSTRDQTNVSGRMAAWAEQLTTRQAMLHAFKLLHRILVDPRQKKISSAQSFGGNNVGSSNIDYSTRSDSDPHRPWIMYFAVLSIWSFAQALKNKGHTTQCLSPSRTRRERTAAEYLSRVAKLSDLDKATSATLCDGLQELLDVVASILAKSHSELLKEACARLSNCKEIMFRNATA